MKLAQFRYHRPTSVAEAGTLLEELADDAKVLAGGQSLIPIMALRLSSPAHLVDIGRIEDLHVIEALPGDSDVAGWVRVGAMTRHAEVECSPVVAEKVPLLAEAATFVGHGAIRTRGTVCGSLAHADPAAELPSVALALGAELEVHGPDGDRIVPAEEFFLGYLQTALEPAEIVVAARFPVRPARTGSSVCEVSRRHGDFALAGAVAEVTVGEDGTIERAAIVHFGVAQVPVRSVPVDDMLLGREPSESLFEEAASAVVRSLDPPADNHASRSYRRHVAGVLTRRVLAQASARAVAA